MQIQKLFVAIFLIFWSCEASLKDYLDFPKLNAYFRHDQDDLPTEAQKPCNENAIMLQLGQLYISSPERIVHLLTLAPLEEVCDDVDNVLSRLHNSMMNCKLADENLYKKLTNGLDYLNGTVCVTGGKSNVKREIEQSQTCLQELREEFIDCEGPADWFESADNVLVCRHINEIADCFYIKTAILCGQKPARVIRNLSANVMKKVTKNECIVPKQSAAFKDPILARYATGSESQGNIKIVCGLTGQLLFIF